MACEKCNGMGFIFFNDEKGRPQAKECECRQVMLSKSRLENSGISEEFQKVGFTDFKTNGNPQLENAFQIAKRYYQEFKDIENTKQNSILFCGQVGSGKTMLSMAISNNLMNACSVGVLYMSYREGITEIKQVTQDKINYDRTLNRYKNARVLMIDDLLKGNLTKTDINSLFEIINYRYINKKPIIVSTEKTLAELLEFDEAVSSRIIEMCKGHIVKLEGSKLNYRIYGN